jgi:fibronectin type 3 domain-containing protein
MNKYIIFGLLLIANKAYTLNIDPEGVGVKNRVSVVEATVQESPPQITINLLGTYYDNYDYEIYRRNLHTNNWGTKLVTLPANTTSWTDTNVSVGDVYEYQIRKKTSTNRDAIGYLAAGIRYDQTNYRGRIILLIDNTIVTPLSTEIEQLKTDLVGDGWFVETIEAERVEGWNGGQAVTVVKQQIVNVYNAAPANDKPKLLFILGHVPVARSGLDMETSDNHSENEGANATDAYYADIDGIWTDTGTHTSPNMEADEDPNQTTFADSNNINIPGDYKWDQNYIPSELELAFGRVDFADLAKPAASEIELYRAYLNKLHNYRHVANGYDVGRKIAIRSQGYEESLDMSYRNGVPIVGSTNIVDQNYGDWATQTGHANWVNNNGPFLAYFQNMWKPEINAIDQLGGLNALLYSSDKSYWGLWGKESVPLSDTGDEWLGYGLSRAVLAATGGLNLIVLWGTSPAIGIFFQTAIGETVGYSVKRSMDHHNSKFNIFEYHGSAQGYGIYPDEHVFLRHTKVPHAHFNGDPSIRFFQVKPASNLVTTINNNTVSLTWNPSSDNQIIGYHVYRANEKLGQYTKLTTTPVTSTSYTDNNPLTGDNWYMLRAIKLDTTGSGSFLNPSQGIFATAVIDDGTPPSTVAPPSNLVASVNNNTVSLTWNASPDNEVTGYEVYRSTTESGNYTKLTTAPITTTSYTDNNPLIGDNWYVVVAIKPDTSGNYLSSDGIFVKAVIQATPPEPASNLVASVNNNTVFLTWNASPDNEVTGYNVYVSSTEFGEYTKLTTTPVTSTSYTDNYPITGDNWYKVTAIKQDTSGNTLSSEGIFVKAVIETTPSSTVTIDFENLPLGIIGTTGTYNNQYDDSKGFTFRDDLNDILHIYGTADDYSSKVLHPNNWYRQIFLTRTNGGTFDLKSFQYGADIWGDLVEATVTGYLTSGGTVSQTYTISSWNMQTLNLNWENLSSVKIDFTTGINGNYGALDNFVLVAK